MSTEVATELEQRIVASINAERDAAGLSQLKIEAHLNAAAQSHSEWMGETGALSHTGENGSSTTDRIGEAGFPLSGSWQASENLAYSSITGPLDAGEADRMHEGLMNSPDHRENILDPDASYVGVGLAVGRVTVDGADREVVFLTENFADTDGQVLVQEEVDGETVLQPYQDGEPVGEPQAAEVPEDPHAGSDDPDDSGDPADPHVDGDDSEDPDPDAHDDTDSRDSATDAGGGCFVATAAYGNRSHPDVVDLRRFRDKVLVRHRAGRVFIGAYGVVGPKIARLVSADGVSGRIVRRLISPLARRARKWTDRRG